MRASEVKAVSATDASLNRTSLSALGPPLQPVTTGVRAGNIVHQVGNHKSFEKIKLVSESVRCFSQNDGRKCTVIRMAWPISSRSSALRRPSGTVRIALSAANDTTEPEDRAATSTHPLRHLKSVTTVFRCKVVGCEEHCSQSH